MPPRLRVNTVLFSVLTLLAAGSASAGKKQKDCKVKKKAFLWVITKPETEVFLDGKKIGTTPIKKKKIPAGEHSIDMVNEDQEVWRSFSFGVLPCHKIKFDKNFTIGPETDRGTLNVRAKPDSEVYINGVKVGDSPIEKLILQSGKYEVILVNKKVGITKTYQTTIWKEKSTTIWTSLSVDEDLGEDGVKVEKKVIEHGTLTISSSIEAKVSINGVVVGQTPLSKLKILPGEHAVLLQNKEQKFEKAVSVSIKAGKDTVVDDSAMSAD